MIPFQQILFYVIVAVLAILIAWLVFLEIRLKKVFRGKSAGDLENLLGEMAKELDSLGKSREEIEKYLESVEKRLKRSAQHVGIVRFNPFHDAGGDQSFALAVMDENKNGIVISSLYGRETSRIYGKPLERGTSKYQLSAEEIKAIETALNKQQDL